MMSDGTLAAGSATVKHLEEAGLGQRIYRAAVRIAAGTVLAVLALVVVAAMRLMSGPIDLDFLKTRIAEAIDVQAASTSPMPTAYSSSGADLAIQ